MPTTFTEEELERFYQQSYFCPTLEKVDRYLLTLPKGQWDKIKNPVNLLASLRWSP